jgi:hypothetical protein
LFFSANRFVNIKTVLQHNKKPFFSKAMMQHLTNFSGIRSLGKKAGFFTLSCLMAFSGMAQEKK